MKDCESSATVNHPQPQFTPWKPNVVAVNLTVSLLLSLIPDSAASTENTGLMIMVLILRGVVFLLSIHHFLQTPRFGGVATPTMIANAPWGQQ